ncbi:hypothetical protein ISS85_00850 [Candidatus Microgenomates bacterium]|nr:hypothetical protein [Candidatus Microgenomates bacterium]
MNVKGLLKFKRNKKTFLLIVIVILSGIVTFGFVVCGWNYFQALQLLREARKLKTDEKYKTAIEILEESQIKTFSKKLHLEVEAELAENKQLSQEKSIYYQGIAMADAGDWERAVDLWEQIPSGSFYYSKVKTTKDIFHEKPDGKTVQLINYNHAQDPTWEEVLEFLKNDSTDDKLYDLDSFVCTGFAEMFHNNAERAGIKTAYVGIVFSEGPGHVINAFNTNDKGLVYVDVTGPGFSRLRDDFLEENNSNCEWDKIGYLAENRPYGTISINYSNLDPIDYQPYENYATLWTDIQIQLEELRGKIDSHNEDSVKHQEKAAAYEINSASYEKLLEDYNQNLVNIQQQIDEEHKTEQETFNTKLADWEKRKAEYEIEVEDYNKMVGDYNDKGIGDPAALQAEKEKLDNIKKVLNEELEKLKEESASIDSENKKQVENEKEKLSEQKENLENLRKDLEKQRKDVNSESESLNALSEEFKNEFGNLKTREQKLNTCYWKPMANVEKIDIYW